MSNDITSEHLEKGDKGYRVVTVSRYNSIVTPVTDWYPTEEEASDAWFYKKYGIKA